MKILLALGVIAMAGYALPASAASQCNSTPWQASNGRTCQSIGLNSDRAVCRSGDAYALFCDDTRTQIRTCQSGQRCAGNSGNGNRGNCPSSIRNEYGSRGCDAYEDGYYYGRRDARDDRRRDYDRHDDEYSRATEDAFREGYNDGYRDND